MCKAAKETWWHYTKCQDTGFRNKISHKVSIRKYTKKKNYIKRNWLYFEVKVEKLYYKTDIPVNKFALNTQNYFGTTELTN